MKCIKYALQVLSLLAVAYTVNASATEIVNIDASKYGYNSTAGATVGDTYSLTNYDPWGGSYSLLQVTLGAGTYTWSNAASIAGGAYSKYSFAWGGTSYAWDFAAFDDATKKLAFTGGISHQSTAAAAESLSAGLTGTFTLASTTTLDFAVRDYFRADNSGGVSLAISPVPEPDAYGMLLLGVGLVGFIARRRGKNETNKQLTYSA